MKQREEIWQAVFFGLIMILTLVMTISGLRLVESMVFAKRAPVETAERRSMERDGIVYYPRQDLTTILMMGIDREGMVQDSGSYTNRGAADAVMLMICDEAAKNIHVLALNRDTMMDMTVLGVDGREAGIVRQQLALAHTYGSGLEDSCENVKMAVSNFLGKISIDHYISVNMDAIGIANDAVGGVTVTITEDFSAVEDALPVGEVTLHGKQALAFVRNRKGIGDQLNFTRMKRQEAYVNGFVEALDRKQEQDDAFILSIYEEMLPYMVTDISFSTFNDLVRRYADYAYKGILSPEGENVLGENAYEFCVDEEALDMLVLDLFYSPKQ